MQSCFWYLYIVGCPGENRVQGASLAALMGHAVPAQGCLAGSDPRIFNHNDGHSFYFHILFLLTYLWK